MNRFGDLPITRPRIAIFLSVQLLIISGILPATRLLWLCFGFFGTSSILTYAVLTPAETTEVSVIEKREIRHNGELVGNPEVTVTHKGGTYTSSIPLTLPADAKKGLYVVTNTVHSGPLSEQLQSAFTVR